METFTELIDDIKRAVLREHTITVLLKSGKRELLALRKTREGTNNRPSAFEQATNKGIWGMDEYQHAAQRELERAFVAYMQYISDESIKEYKAIEKNRKAAKAGKVVVEVKK